MRERMGRLDQQKRNRPRKYSPQEVKYLPLGGWGIDLERGLLVKRTPNDLSMKLSGNILLPSRPTASTAFCF